MKREVMCVRHRDGWCALKPGCSLDPLARYDPTACQMIVTLRIGAAIRRPTCRECRAALKNRRAARQRGGDTQGRAGRKKKKNQYNQSKRPGGTYGTETQRHFGRSGGGERTTEGAVMSEKAQALIVVLKDDMRIEDDLQPIVTAIGLMRGVLRVEVAPTDHYTEYVAEERVRADLTKRLWDVLHPKKGA